jgi:hypothetical protein
MKGNFLAKCPIDPSRVLDIFTLPHLYSDAFHLLLMRTTSGCPILLEEQRSLGI